ncbi:MAG: acetyl-CoA carboxylase biotin carboxyl carrier protein [Chloroflexi bacterium]|nr:acetyl-CoA carboxylase biotin carboxyl carrier protein [Chloroflexota bacterium]
MADQDPVLRAIDLLTPAFEESGLDELEVEADDLKVRLARPRAAVAEAPALAPTVAAPEAAQPAPVAPDRLTPFGEPSPGMRFVSAPLTGVWYAAPSPGARAYVAEGDEIHDGQVVGLIEAMKLFNEIKADASGKVHRILVESGTLVKRKQPILEIDPR